MSSPARIANQDVINVFFEIAPRFGLIGWGFVQKAGWEWLGVPPPARNQLFDWANLNARPPGLTDAEWDAVARAIRALAPAGPSPSFKLTNQQIVNLLYELAPQFREDGWQLIRRAGWEWLVSPPSNRNNLFSESRLQQKPPGLTQSEWNVFLQAVDSLLASTTGGSSDTPVSDGGTTVTVDTAPVDPSPLRPTREIINQEVVNIFFEVAPQFGEAGWNLVEKAGWEWLAVPPANRHNIFNPGVMQPPPAGLTVAEWEAVSGRINALIFAPLEEEGGWPGWWPWKRALVGLHGRGDGPNRDTDFDRFRAARIESLKYLSRGGDTADRHVREAQEARSLTTVTFGPTPIVLRPMFNFPRNRHISPQAFVEHVADHMQAFAAQPDVLWLVEIHNEPNVFVEGFGGTWDNGREFADWWLETRELLRPTMPAETKWGFPGLSPGGPSEFRGMGEHEFFEQSEAAWRAADWVGAHSYWQSEPQMTDPEFGFSWKWIMDRSGKPVAITEFANTAEIDERNGPTKSDKAREYVAYYRRLRKVEGLLGAYSFIVSVSGQEWEEQEWSHGMARIVGARGF